MRYGILMHRIPAHEERKRQQNRKTQISFSVLLPALFFLFFFPFYFSLFVPFRGSRKAENSCSTIRTVSTVGS